MQVEVSTITSKTEAWSACPGVSVFIFLIERLFSPLKKVDVDFVVSVWTE